MRFRPLMLMALTTLFVTACATDGNSALSRETRKERYNKFAGEPVRQVRMINLHSWTNIDRHQVVLWTNAREAYLVDLFSPCLNLDRAMAIGVSNFGNTVYARSDAIVVGGERCLIDQIRPIDTKALKEDQRNARSATLQSRAEQS